MNVRLKRGPYSPLYEQYSGQQDSHWEPHRHQNQRSAQRREIQAVGEWDAEKREPHWEPRLSKRQHSEQHWMNRTARDTPCFRSS